ncbi:unnamed protein product [Nezara viridula]|uniref:Uncharacterized protein n=1 Tax=Nezara viridula TaxID=85310 RepID=A0A9P0E498_NEZVI|nr:unnamed protein product [Nezara viridula]
MPIPIPSGDPFYPRRNVSTGERVCLPFMRSLPGQHRLGPREQINQNTAYLDGSQIYGEHACLARELRGFGGKMNATRHPTQGKDLLPISPSHPECKAPSGYCFIGGDGRASEQPGLTAMHTIYLREHNRLVDGLRGVNPHWGDEKLFQTARKITVASYQHVLYNEFLPRILGWNAINLYGLKLNSQAYYKGYSSTCNPTIVTEFATAAYRIGHSLLRPHIPRMGTSYNPVEPAILLRDHFFNPDIIYQPHIIDDIMRGLASTPMESLDQFITGEITNHLFEDRRIPHSGMDLPALNVQRARDHGIPPYNEYRSLCNLKRAVTWDDLSREIPAEVIARLRLIYPTVNDVDLFPGGLSERPLQGGLVGPTNPRVKCNSLPTIDLNAWRETAQTGCQIAGRTVAVGESYIPTPCTSCICTPEGAQCASLRVTDCDRLLREAGMEAVLEDEVCSSQCGEYLTRQTSVIPSVSLTTRRPRTHNGGFLPTSLVPPPPVRQNKRRPHLRPFDVPPPLLV